MKLEHTCRSIALAGHEQGGEAAKTALQSAFPAHRAVAISAIARQKKLGEIDLATLAKDPSPSVRVRLLETVARLTTDEIGRHNIDPLLREIIALLDDADCGESAAFALGELGSHYPLPPDAVRRLEEMATSHQDHLAREAAVVALGTIGQGQQTVLAALNDRATVRRRAVIALANFAGDEVEAALQQALNDRDHQVRQIAEDLTAEPPPEMPEVNR